MDLSASRSLCESRASERPDEKAVPSHGAVDEDAAFQRQQESVESRESIIEVAVPTPRPKLEMGPIQEFENEESPSPHKSRMEDAPEEAARAFVVVPEALGPDPEGPEDFVSAKAAKIQALAVQGASKESPVEPQQEANLIRVSAENLGNQQSAKS